MTFLRTSIAATIALVFTVACSGKPVGKTAPPAICQHNGNGEFASDALDRVRQAIAKEAGKPDLGTVAVVGIGEACAKDLPDPIPKAMRSPGTGTRPADFASVAAAALAKVPEFGRAACKDFDKVMPEVAAAQTDQAKILYEGCHYEALDLVSADELTKAFGGDDKGGALLAPATYVWFVDHHMAKPDAKYLARAMMGLP